MFQAASPGINHVLGKHQQLSDIIGSDELKIWSSCSNQDNNMSLGISWDEGKEWGNSSSKHRLKQHKFLSRLTWKVTPHAVLQKPPPALLGQPFVPLLWSNWLLGTCSSGKETLKWFLWSISLNNSSSSLLSCCRAPMQFCHSFHQEMPSNYFPLGHAFI